MKKKSVIIFSIVVVILLIVAFVCIFRKEEDRVKKLYNKLSENMNYTFSMEEVSEELNCKISMIQRNDDIFIDMYSNNEHTSTLIFSGNSYFINHDDKEYMNYGSEKISDTEIVVNELKNIIKEEYNSGNEIIEGKRYYYEEFENENLAFTIYANVNEESKVKTRFYFNGLELKYIKHIIISGNETYEELIKTNVKYKINEDVFEIPKDYSEIEE